MDAYRIRMRLGFFGALFLAAVAIGFIWMVLSMLPEKPIISERSPDGLMIAEYSWRPSGPIDLFTEISPRLYLTIRDAQTGNIISRQGALGDGHSPGDAKSLFRHALPWKASPK